MKINTSKFHPHYLSLMLAALFLIQASPFLSGYRLTADDVYFHQLLMNGWPETFSWIEFIAKSQGRFVHFIDLPFSILGAYYSDSIVFRTLYTALYFSIFFLLGIYVSILLLNRNSYKIVLLISLLLISFHPLDYYHLAPNAYPLHISLPILLILSSRTALWNLRNSNQSKPTIKTLSLQILFFLGICFSELTFLFGLSLYLTELTVKFIKQQQTTDHHHDGSFRSIIETHDLYDIFSILLFLLIYISYRIANPSNYDGNSIDSSFNFSMFFKTLIGHIYGGTSFSSFDRNRLYILHDFFSYNFFSTLSILAIFLLTSFISYISIFEIVKNKCTPAINTSLVMALGTSMLSLSLLVTFPIALTSKYQNWCTTFNTCIYLDSRVSYLGLCVFFFTSIVMLIKTSRYLVVQQIAGGSICLFIATMACLTYVNNKRIQIDMQDYVMGWKRAAFLACAPELNSRNDKLSTVIDPHHRISFHVFHDPETYWSDFILNQIKNEKCSHPKSFADLYPKFTKGHSMQAGIGGEAIPFLENGWSKPESWGTWSIENQSTIFLPYTENITGITIEARAFVSAQHPKQNIIVNINGIKAVETSFYNSEQNIIKFILTDEARHLISMQDFIRLDFTLPDAISPQELGLGNDSRKLAIGLTSISVR